MPVDRFANNKARDLVRNTSERAAIGPQAHWYKPPTRAQKDEMVLIATKINRVPKHDDLRDRQTAQRWLAKARVEWTMKEAHK